MLNAESSTASIDDEVHEHVARLISRVGSASDCRIAASEAASELNSCGAVSSLESLLWVLEGDLAGFLRRREQFEAAWELSLELWDRAGKEDATLQTIDRMAAWLTSAGLFAAPVDQVWVHNCANRFAWSTRGSTADLGRTLDAVTDSDRFRLYVLAERLRFTSKFDDLLLLLRASDLAEDPVLLALLGLGQVATGDLLNGLPNLETAIGYAKKIRSGLERSVQDICMHAIWLADAADNQAELLLEWSLVVPDNPSSIVPFRRAKAYRILGQYDRALEEIQRAFDRLTGNTEFARIFAEQILRERDLVHAFQLMNRAQGELECAIRDAKEQALDEVHNSQASAEARLQELDRNSLVRTIEIVTLFTAAVSFAIGGISIAGGDGLDSDTRLSLLFALGGGLLTFALFIFLAFELVRIRSHNASAPTAASLRSLSPLVLAYLGLLGVNLGMLWILS